MASQGHISSHKPHWVHNELSIFSMLHNTILKYIALVKSAFNNLKVTHKDTHGHMVSKSIPMTYGRKEKALIVDNYTDDQMLKGNVHVIPYGYISLDAFSKDDTRMTNKNRMFKAAEAGDKFSYNSVPYDFVFSIMIRCRGVTEAYQIVEQVAPMFNPTVNLDVWDALYLDVPTRVCMILDGLDVEAPEYDENSNNIYTVSLSVTLKGWIYQPILTRSLIENTLLNLAMDENDPFLSQLNDELLFSTNTFKLDIIDIIRKGNELTPIVDSDERLALTYVWSSEGADLEASGSSAKVKKADGEYSVELVVKDQFGNFTSMIKKFRPAVYT